jgi:glycine/D-amino acid oxidase-like deaminating enzyme
MYQSYLGAAGNPVEWTDRYLLRDSPDGDDGPWQQDSHGFASYRDRLKDLVPAFHDMPPGSTPFPTAVVRRSSSLTFNIASYARTLIEEFQLAGGRIQTREFLVPADLGTLSQKVIINCTGYGARALWRDDSIIPVRGQIAWLIPQPGVNYGIYYHELGVLARRDGIVIQPSPQGDDTGWNDDNEAPDRAEAESGVRALQALYSRMTPVTRLRSS